MQGDENDLRDHKYVFLLYDRNDFGLEVLEDELIGPLHAVVLTIYVQDLRSEDRLQIKVHICF